MPEENTEISYVKTSLQRDRPPPTGMQNTNKKEAEDLTFTSFYGDTVFMQSSTISKR